MYPKINLLVSHKIVAYTGLKLEIARVVGQNLVFRLFLEKNFCE